MKAQILESLANGRSRAGPSTLFHHLQPRIDKNTEDLAVLILEFDDVTVKII